MVQSFAFTVFHCIFSSFLNKNIMFSTLWTKQWRKETESLATISLCIQHIYPETLKVKNCTDIYCNENKPTKIDTYLLQLKYTTTTDTSISDQRLPTLSLQASHSSSSPIPSPRGSLGHHRWFHNQFPPFFPSLHCPPELGKLQACPFPDVVFPPLLLSASSSSPFHCALQDVSGQTRWTGHMTIPLQFASLYDGQEVFVWSDCLLDLGTDFLVGSMVLVWVA